MIYSVFQAFENLAYYRVLVAFARVFVSFAARVTAVETTWQVIVVSTPP